MNTQLLHRVWHTGTALALISASAALSGCGGRAVDPGPLGPVVNEFVEPVTMLRAENGDPLPARIRVATGDVVVVTFEIQAKAQPPAEYQGRKVTPAEEHPCLFAAYPPGISPDLNAHPSKARPTVTFAALCRDPTAPHFPVAGIGSWAVAIPKEQLPGPITNHEDGAVPFAAIIGATHSQPGTYALDLYTYPTATVGSGLGAPLLLWRGELVIAE